MPPQKNDWANAAARVGLKLVTTGNVVWMAVILISLSVIWRMDSADIKECVISFVGWPWFGITGWLLFLLTLLLGKWVLRMQLKLNQGEIDRMARVRDQAMQPQLELEMRSSKKL